MTKALLPTFHFSEKKIFFFQCFIVGVKWRIIWDIWDKRKVKRGGRFFLSFWNFERGVKVRLHKGEKGGWGGGGVLKYCFLLLLPHFFPDGYLGLGGRFGEGRRGLGRGKGEGV